MVWQRIRMALVFFVMGLHKKKKHGNLGFKTGDKQFRYCGKNRQSDGTKSVHLTVVFLFGV